MSRRQSIQTQSVAHPSMSEEVETYLKSGGHDPKFEAWPGSGFFDRSQNGSKEMREALVAEVLARTQDRPATALPDDLDILQFTHQKFSGMVKGLFPKIEQAIVLAMLERSVIFLTPRNIVPVLREMPWLGTAWDLANLYLASHSAELLSVEAQPILGLSIETTCYVSTDYFRAANPFDDFVLHEAAHVFHNCKRETLGLPHSRHREWLLEIEYRKRETFAYACEAYSRLLELGRDSKHRQDLLSELAATPLPNDERVDGAEYLDILAEAVTARNGWKRILARCSPSRVRNQTIPTPTS
ncbi:hypothetical protein ACMYR3_08520 [Ampullimonas aquatilis]|jgi:hypothetical protein|uniref:hypothetical protein n=1 Tax=Ampullimonas aquatilis TaxID=1341549 RepID=UPI003C777175